VRTLFAALFLLAGSAAYAAEPTFDGNPAQGGLLVGHTNPESTVTVDGQHARVSPDGLFLVGLGRDATKAVVVVTDSDGKKTTKTIPVKKRQYQIDKINGLPEAQVSPDPEAMKHIRADNAEIAKARALDTAETYFASGFQWPVIGRISGVYGSQRILNGEPRQPHFGVDIAAPMDTPIHATADGVIAVVDQDMFFTGRTLMIDHGHGLTSVYAHMNKILVTEGQVVKKGDVIGLIGMTGRVTGPHTHWGMSLFKIPLDPALLVGPMPVPEK
jgi:murein DD-endopeptidase MepM/ murein hydrolase activator NlpD